MLLILRSLSAGWTSLHWKSLNIDVFLHKVHVDINHLKTAVNTINTTMATINDILASIANSKMFDLMVAASEVWVSVCVWVGVFVCACMKFACVYVLCIYITFTLL